MFFKSIFRKCFLFVISTLIAVSFILTGCSNNNLGKTTENEVKNNMVMKDFNDLTKKDPKVIEVIQFIDSNISAVSKEDASEMLILLEKIQKKYLTNLEEKFYSGTNQEKINKVYSPGNEMLFIDNVKEKDLKELLEETKNSGYKVETSEGCYYPVINYEFYKKYANSVTPDIRDFIEIMSVESNNVPMKDAALMIGWDEVLNRARNLEDFIDKYNNSIKINDMKKMYKEYLSRAIYGGNNTPLFSYDTNTMVSEAKDIYSKVALSSTNSKINNIINEYMKVIKKNNYKLTDEVEKYRNNILLDK